MKNETKSAKREFLSPESWVAGVSVHPVPPPRPGLLERLVERMGPWRFGRKQVG